MDTFYKISVATRIVFSFTVVALTAQGEASSAPKINYMGLSVFGHYVGLFSAPTPFKGFDTEKNTRVPSALPQPIPAISVQPMQNSISVSGAHFPKILSYFQQSPSKFAYSKPAWSPTIGLKPFVSLKDAWKNILNPKPIRKPLDATYFKNRLNCNVIKRNKAETDLINANKLIDDLKSENQNLKNLASECPVGGGLDMLQNTSGASISYASKEFKNIQGQEISLEMEPTFQEWQKIIKTVDTQRQEAVQDCLRANTKIGKSKDRISSLNTELTMTIQENSRFKREIAELKEKLMYLEDRKSKTKTFGMQTEHLIMDPIDTNLEENEIRKFKEIIEKLTKEKSTLDSQILEHENILKKEYQIYREENLRLQELNDQLQRELEVAKAGIFERTTASGGTRFGDPDSMQNSSVDFSTMDRK